jgi:ribosomal protein S12 methylthiotransferase accessory factor
MEAIERYSGERCDLPVHTASYPELARSHAAVDPSGLIVPRSAAFRPDMPLEWVRGFDLIARRATFVPLNAVVCPYDPPEGGPAFLSSTNGLASGNTLDEALCHALCEINERDAQALCAAAGALRDAVGGLLAALGRGRAGSGDPGEPGRGRRLRAEGLPPRAARLLRRLRDAGLLVYLRDLTGETGIPAIDCTVAERRPDGTYLACGGVGSHPDARVAAIRALTEAAQSRVAVIQGGREDLAECFRHAVEIRDPDAHFGRGRPIDFAEIPTREHRTVSEDLAWILGRFAASGLSQAVAIDLTRPELGVPVVRVVVPEAEFWPLQQLHTGRCQIGPRGMRLVRGAAR